MPAKILAIIFVFDPLFSENLVFTLASYYVGAIALGILELGLIYPS
jgi:hypothetical protein